jgi:hypothetical protein
MIQKYMKEQRQWDRWALAEDQKEKLHRKAFAKEER